MLHKYINNFCNLLKTAGTARALSAQAPVQVPQAAQPSQKDQIMLENLKQLADSDATASLQVAMSNPALSAPAREEALKNIKQKQDIEKMQSTPAVKPDKNDSLRAAIQGIQQGQGGMPA